MRSSLINDKIRNKDGKLTRFLTGRRFVFVNIPQRPLERTVKIGGFTARLYYKEQPRADPQQTTCSRCLERGHRVSACPNNIRYRECRQEGHKRGDPVCDAVSVWGPQGSVGQRGDTQVSSAMASPTPDSQVASIREPPTPDAQFATPGNPHPSNRRPTTRLPAVTSTSGRIPCRRSTTCHRNSRVRKPPPDSYQ